MRKSLLVATALILAVATLGSMGCRRVKLTETPAGRSVNASTETTQVALGGAEALDTIIRMGVGELKLTAGEPSSTVALVGTFDYAPAEWKPEVKYSVDGTEGALYVSQPDPVEIPGLGTTRNTWTVKIAPDVPTNLSLKLGVGESDVNLRGVDLTKLEALTGVGEAKIDLSGERTRDLTARIEAGVGEVTISVPTDVGVRIIGAGDGVGDFTAEGFTRDGSSGSTPDGGDLVNAAWSGDGPKIELFITHGIGDVKVVSVD
jgi:hypothetical protein